MAPTHTLATEAGAFNKNGWPIAARVYPAIQAPAKPILLIKTFNIMPAVVRSVPINTPVLHPYASITKLLGKLTIMYIA